MYIIQLKQNENGARPPMQSWVNDAPPDGFAISPDSLLPAFTAAKGFVNITVDSGIVTAMTENTAARRAWESLPKPAPQPTVEETALELLADQEYRLCNIELGLNK